MLRQKLLLPRFRRYMLEEDWHLLQKGNNLNILAGVLTGLSLVIMMPASLALATQSTSWGLSFWPWMLVLALIALMTSLCSYHGAAISYRAGLGFMRNMQIILGQKVARLPLGYFQANTAGRLSRMVTQEMMSLGQTVAYFMGQEIKSISSALIFVLGAWFWQWELGLLLTLAVPILFGLMRLGQYCVGRGSALEDPAEQKVAARIVEFAKCQGALRACHAGSSYPELKESLEHSRKESTRGLIWGSLGNFLSGMGTQILVFVMISLISQLAIKGQITALNTLVMIGISLRYTTILSDISAALFGIEERRQMINGLDAVLDSPELPVLAKSQAPLSGKEICFAGVDFSYQPGQKVLKHIDFQVDNQEMYAIVGPSGSGKTTIIKLIARFYDVNAGSISIGGVDVRELSTKDLFKNISLVFQDVYLFNDSLKNNILMARPEASMEELEKAATLAGVQEIVKRLPEGWESICGEGGRSLSGGEKQRVSIARALLKKSPVVLFDEATSALDAENEAHIIDCMQALRESSTLLVVAHKLETIQMADKILVLSADGQIAERGTHDELLALNGAYKEFWNKRQASAAWRLA